MTQAFVTSGVDPRTAPDYAHAFAEFWHKNHTRIVDIARRTTLHDDAHWDLIEEMKDVLSAEASNNSSDSVEEQESAAYDAEQWVTSELSCSDEEVDVAMALWLYGMENGMAWLAKNQAPKASVNKMRY